MCIWYKACFRYSPHEQSNRHPPDPKWLGYDVGDSGVKASVDWLSGSGAEFSAGIGRTGTAHLRHYTARYCEWGSGPPLLLVPGLAGGIELLGPLAALLARDFRVISYQLRGEDDCFA